jgi:hypothetical protein
VEELGGAEESERLGVSHFVVGVVVRHSALLRFRVVEATRRLLD